MTPGALRWRVFDDPEALAREAARTIGDAAAAAIAAHGEFRLVLAGGRTPEATYRLLAGQNHDWPRWQFYFGDERCLPVSHADRNSTMVRKALFERVPLREHQIHTIAAELGARRAAAAYADVVAQALPFDLVILGLGEDGHTASLFPGRTLDPDALTVAVDDAPKPPPERVSLGLRALNASRQILVLAAGSGKRPAVRAWRAGADLPVTQVCAAGRVSVFLDAAATAPGDNPP